MAEHDNAREGEREPVWAARFLEALRDGQNVRAASRTAGVQSSTPYHRRRTHEAFRAAWDACAPGDGRRNRQQGPRRARGSTQIDRFIAELAETSNVAAAAHVAGLQPGTIYRLRRSDPEFARRWYEALAEGYDNLEMELLAHLRGSDGSGASDSPRKFDVAAALRCLTAHRESVARERGRRTLADEVATIAAINAKIDAMRLRAKEGEAAIRAARKGNARRTNADGEA